MKLILNGQDVTDITGEPIKINNEWYLPISALKKVKQSGVSMTEIDDQLRIEISPTALLKATSKDNSFPVTLDLKTIKDKNGDIKAKAELLFGNFAKASVDQDGRIETAVTIKL